MFDPAVLPLLEQRSGPEEWIYIVIGVIYLLWSILKPIFKRLAGSSGQSTSTTTVEEIFEKIQQAQTPAEQVQPQVQSFDQRRTAGKANLEAQARRAEALREAVNEMVAEIRLSPSMFHFVAALDGYLLPQINDLAVQLERDVRGADGVDASLLERKTSLYERQIRYYNATFRIVQQILRSRDARGVRDLLADADRVADRCFEPIRAFGKAYLDTYPLENVVCLLDGRDLSVTNQLAATGMALVHLPDDFATNVTLWPAIAHEVAHVAYYSIPGLADEVARLMPAAPATQLFWVTQTLTTDHIDQLIAAWAEELFADIFGAMQFGPAYIIGQTTQFASLDDPRLTAYVGVNGARYDEHPPAQVRVRVAAQALEFLGYSRAAHEAVEHWSKAHGGMRADYFLSGIEGKLVAVDAEVIDEPVRQLTERIVEHQFNSLSGFTLRDLPGLAFAENQHYGAIRDAEQMLAGNQVTHLDAREIVAAVVYLAARGDQSPETLAAFLRSGVLGLGVGEHIENPEYRTRPRQAAADPKAWFEALVLGEVLKRSGARL